MSGRGRSGVWDLEQRQRILHLQPLRTAWLGEPGALTAVVRERDRDAHSIVGFDLQKVPTVKAREVGGAGWWLHGGRVVLAGRPANPERPGRDVMLEARDVTTDKVLWSRRFAREAPHRQVNQDTGMLVLVWPLDDGDALELKMLHTIQFGT